MTEKEFNTLCSETKIGTSLSFDTGEELLYGKFVGCTEDGVVIEANGQNFIWPWEVIDYRRPGYPTPSYS